MAINASLSDNDGKNVRREVTSGLLIGAERLQDGETVYRMAAQPVQERQPSPEDFTLPDGRELWITEED